MEKTFRTGLHKMLRQFRFGAAALACLAVTALAAFEASASVDFINQWPTTPTIVSNSAAGTISGRYTPALGNNRLMLVTVATKYSTGPAVAPSFTVTYGGQTVTEITKTSLASAPNGIWVGYLTETAIGNGITGGKSLQVINNTTTNLTAMYATVAVFNGINQTTPLIGFGQNALAAAAPTVASSVTMTTNLGLTGNNSLNVYVTNWAGVNNNNSVSGYSENRDILSAAGTINLAGGYKVTSGTATETTTSTATSAFGAIASVGLNPALRVATNSTCGDCHGNPPVDGTARNVPASAVLGSHDKHAAGSDKQYGYACIVCHYDNGTTNYKHADGFKNITGSRLPGNAYLAGKRIPFTDSPTTVGTCSNTSCHSTGRSTPQFNTTPAWGTNNTLTCLSCHAGRVSAQGATANSSAGFKLSTTHMQHMKAPYTAANVNCNVCHAKTVTDAATLKSYSGMIYHANGTPDVLFTNIAYASYTSYKAGTKTCSNVSCHGGKTRGAWTTASINSDNTCVHCHGVAGTSTADTNRNKFAPGYGGGISTDGNSASSDPRVGGHFKHLSSVYFKKMKCNECHLVPANPYDAGHTDSARFNSATITFAQSSTANKNTTTPAYTNGSAAVAATCNTTYCHGSKMPKGDTGGSDKSPLWNAALTASTPDNATCGRCHGNPPVFGSSSSAHIGSLPTTSCSACHKTVTDATGKIINKSLHMDGLLAVQVDTAATTGCNKCHGNPPQTLTYGRYSGLVKSPKTLAMGASPANAGAHKKHADNGLTCNTCHNGYASSVHPDNKIQIFFRISSSTITGWNTTAQRAAYGTYSGNIPTGGTPVDTVSSTLVRGTADSINNSCNTYCHGGWANSNRNMNPRWTSGTTATTCGACHGASAAAPPQIGTHARHAGYSSAATARQGYSFSCAKCHPNRIAGNHVKGAVHVRFSTAVLGANATYTKTGATLATGTGTRTYTTKGLAGDTADGTCSNISCHSTGRGATMGTVQYPTTPPTWGTTGRNCLACHAGRASATGAPAHSSSNFTLSTTHSQHLKYPAINMNCQICHSKTVTDAATLKNYTGVKRHANGVRDVTFTGLAYGTYTAYKSTESGSIGTSKTCNNVSCHGGKSRGAWSATAQNTDNTCLHCHGAGTGTGTALRADKYNAAPGWGGTGTSTDQISVNTDIRVGAHFVHLSSVYMKKLKCNECHMVPANPFDGTHMATARYNSQTLAFTQASSANKNSVVPAFTAGTSVAAATCNTTFCHGSGMPKGDTSGTDKSPLWNANLTTGTPGAAECARCHGNPPTVGTSASVHSSYVGTPTTSCYNCHGMVVSNTGAIIDKSLHMNGSVQSLTACNACHDYDTFGGTWGTVKNQNYGGTATAEGRSNTAHYKHIEYLKTKYGVSLNTTDTWTSPAFMRVCGTCHSINEGVDHSMGTPSNARSITFGDNGTNPRNFGGAPTYNGNSATSSSVNPKSCSNIDCHYRTSPIWSTFP